MLSVVAPTPIPPSHEFGGCVVTPRVEGRSPPPATERAMAGGRKAKLLLELGDGFEGYDPGAILADATVGGGHLGSFERIAVVTDAEWIRRAIQLFGGLIPGDVRLFSVAERTAARDWIGSTG
jgi:hypothetical protein